MSNFVHQYQRELDRCRQQFESLDLRKQKGYLFKFTTFSASVQNILPEIPIEKHEELFQKLLLQQVYTTFDQQFLTANDLIQTKGPVQELITSPRPNIYCTFHLGSYRLMATYLYRNGLDVTLMVSSGTYQQQGKDIWTTIKGLQKKHKLTNSFQMLDAEQPSSTLQVIRALQAGTSLVIFIDGVTSTTGVNRQEDKEVQVRFGAQNVWARKGVGFLSHLTQTPIIPVIGYREKNMNNVLSFLDPIIPEAGCDRESYCRRSLQQIYDLFWHYLTKYPEQWEGWNYIHKFLDQHELEQHADSHKLQRHRLTKRVAFNHERYSICDLEEAPILFDRRLYLTYEISSDLRDFLLQIGTIETPEEALGTDLYLDLLSKQIIS
ncbi:hypothetical protein ACFQ4C_27755 [Larkinella insperata]|uniref:Lauroyl/myristoyl acyltransferase n=1 Tax=Larkinella insperata TaxID=332158 RepID=A0ABW3QG01_9BACT|nr:hypothetical protein [Larkinella insperata]